MCILADGLPFLLYSKPHTGSKVIQTTIPTASIIEEWINKAVQPPPASEIETLITADSYYLSEEGQKLVQERRQPIIASVSEQRFSNLSSFARDRVRQAGERVTLHNARTGESFVRLCYNSVR